jgi:branched-chain amino acid transport system permease protein
MLAGAVAAALFGLVIALPALRLRADYLAIVTVAVSEIFRLVVRNPRLESTEIGGLYLGLGGGDGLQLDWGSEAELLFDALFLGGVYDGLVAALDGVVAVPQTAVDRIIYGLILLVFVLLYYALLQRLGNSPFGRVLKAIREDEEATNSLGKDTNRFKIIVFMVGCGLMGLLGVLWFMNAGGRGTINHTQFRPTLTFFIWVALIIGGAGSNTGSVMGGAVFAAVLFRGPRFLQTVIDELTGADLRTVARGGLGEAMAPIAGSFDPMPLLLYTAAKIQDLQLLIMGLVIIYLMHNRPDGLLGHRKEQAAAISLSRPDRRSGGERAVAADGGIEDE